MHTILYIEDNLTNRQLVEMIIVRREGFSFLEAKTGESGLEIAFSQHPDLILLDITLPDIDGPEVWQRLHANPQTRDIPVIAISGESIELTKQTCPYFFAYLTKPINVQALYSAIDQALNII